MTRFTTVFFTLITATSVTAQDCFPICNSNTWKTVGCSELCSEEFWDNANAGDLQQALDDGQSVNAQNGEGWEPIHYAAKFGTAQDVLALLEAGADVNGHYLETQNETPLFAVLSPVYSQFRTEMSGGNYKFGLFAAQQQLLVRLNRRHFYRYPIFDETEIQRIKPIVAVLISGGADVNFVGAFGWSAVSNSVKFGAIDITEMLVDAGANVNSPDDAGVWPIHHSATLYDSMILAQILLNGGADINASDPQGNTTLSSAIATRNYNLAKSLIAAGADVNTRNIDDVSPLSMLVEEFRLLDYNLANMLEFRRDGVETAELLLEAGAESHLPNRLASPPTTNGSTDEKFPHLKALLDNLGNSTHTPTFYRDEICTTRTRRGTTVQEVQIPCPD